MALEINVTEKEPQIYTIALKGEINTETYGELAKTFKDLIPKCKAIVMDMAGVKYISSMGLSAFFRAKAELEAKAATIALINMQPTVSLVFETTKVMGAQMFASLQEADEYLDKYLDNVQSGKIKPKIKPL